MTIKKIMVFSQANENFFYLWEPFFGRVDASMMINQHRHHHSIASFFSALRGPIKEVKKRKPSKFHCESTQHIFKQLDLLQVPQKGEYVSSSLLPKHAKLKKKKKTSRANHSKLKLNEILEDLFYIAAHNLRTLQLRREHFHRSR